MFIINKVLAIKQDPFGKPIDLTILETVELYIKQAFNLIIRLNYVSYKEVSPIKAAKLSAKPAKPGYRYFYISQAFNQRDK